MSPDGEIKKMTEFMKEQEKSEKELKESGYQELTHDEAEYLAKLPEEKRVDALIRKRHGDLRNAAFSESYKLRQETQMKDKKKEKKKRKMIKASRRKNRKRK